MLNYDKTNKTLTPIVVGLFLAASLVPSNSAIPDEQSATSNNSGSGAVLEAEEPLALDKSHILLASSGEAVTSEATSAVVGLLEGAVPECRSAGSAYAASCVAKAFKRAASRAHNPDYYDARRDLRNAAKKLEKLVSKNADKKAPKKKGKYGTYKAIKQEAVAAVKQEAIKIIKEAETNLLRSSGNEIRKIHYKRIAQAVGSTKVIFRS